MKNKEIKEPIGGWNKDVGNLEGWGNIILPKCDRCGKVALYKAKERIGFRQLHLCEECVSIYPKEHWKITKIY